MPVITVPGPVEIDECHLWARIRGAHGRHPAPGTIIFGIKCRSTGIVLLFPVPNKNKNTLLPILVSNVEQGATVISDKFSSYISRNNYSHIDDLGFEHYFVNHSLTFVDPIQTSIHTNCIERVWRSLRASVSHVKRSFSTDDD